MENFDQNFDAALKLLLSYSWIVIGLTQVVKDELKRLGIDNPGLYRLAAMIFGALTGLFFTGGELVGFAAGTVMGLITTGVVSTVFQGLEKKSPAVVIEELPVNMDIENKVKVKKKNKK